MKDRDLDAKNRIIAEPIPTKFFSADPRHRHAKPYLSCILESDMASDFLARLKQVAHSVRWRDGNPAVLQGHFHQPLVMTN